MKPRLNVAIATLALVSCVSPAPPPAHVAQHEGPRNLPIPPDLRGEIESAEDIGRQLYLLDKVSAIATDAAVARVPDLRAAGVVGYIPMQDADEAGQPQRSFLVTFFTGEDPPRIAYEVRVKPDVQPEFQAFDPPKTATDSFLILIRARQAAIAALPPVHQPMNPVLMPGAARGEKGILVSFLAGTKRPGVAVFGQHFRVLMPENGQTPTYVMPLSKSALEMPTKAGPNGAKTEALVVTHLVTDWPLETHVLVSLQWHLPVYVGTRRGVWHVDGDRIDLIGDRPRKECSA